MVRIRVGGTAKSPAPTNKSVQLELLFGSARMSHVGGQSQTGKLGRVGRCCTLTSHAPQSVMLVVGRVGVALWSCQDGDGAASSSSFSDGCNDLASSSSSDGGASCSSSCSSWSVRLVELPG